MIRTLLAPLFFFLILAAHAQNLSRIDSLKKAIPGLQGAAKFDCINKLAWEHRFANPDSTIYFARQAYALGQELKLKKRLAEPLNFIGVANNYMGKRLEAYDNFSAALELAVQQKDSIQIAHSNNNIGRLFFEQGLVSRSYEYFIASLDVFRRIGDKSGIAYSLQSLANLYRSQKDFAKSMETYKEALAIRRELKNPRDIMSAYVQLGHTYQDMGEWDKSVACFISADSAGTSIGDEINLAEINMYMASSYLKQKRLKEAEEIAIAGFRIIDRTRNVRSLPEANITMGQIYMAKGNLVLANQHFSDALAVAIETKELAPQMDAYYYLWEISKRMNQPQAALTNYNHYLILKDSIKDLDLARQVERLEFQLEIDKKEKENALLKINRDKNEATIQQQRTINIMLTIILVTAAGFVVALWLINKKRKEANDKLVSQKREIEKQREEIITQNDNLSRRNHELSELNHEKDTLMSIVAHDLKSPLNRIKGLTDLLEVEGALNAGQKGLVNMMKDATGSGLDLITDLLDVHMLEENVEPAISVFDLSKFICEKAEAFQPAAAGKDIHIQITKIEHESVQSDMDYLSRIIDNLLSNAIKFSKRSANIKIAAGKSDEGFWITVKDQGPGFSEADKAKLFQKFKKLSARPTGGETSNGLGLAIVKTLVDRLGGKIELRTEQGNGSEFYIFLPYAKVSTEV